MQEIAKDSMSPKTPWRPSRKVVFLSGIGVGVFFTLFIPYLVRMRNEALQYGCVHNMKHILMALHSYHDKYETFPPAYTVDEQGNPLHSWRVLILPHLGEEELYQQIRLDEPWDSEHNSRLHKQMPTIFCCPADRKKQPLGETSYVWILGEGHISDGTSCTKISDITDGTSNTIMLVETLDPFCWMVPKDINLHVFWTNYLWIDYFGPEATLKGFSSNHRHITNIGCADGSVEQLPYEAVDLYFMQRMSTIAGGEALVCP